MKVKKLRYNLLMFGLIALIGCYVGMNFFMPASTPSMNDGTADSTISDVDDDPGDVVEEDPSMSEPPKQGTKVPTKDLDLVLYALDIMNNGEGFSAKFETSVLNNAVGIAVTQNVKGTVERGVNDKGERVSVEKNFYQSGKDVPSVAAGQVVNMFKGFYLNEATDSAHVVLSENYNYANSTYSVEGALTNDQLSISQAKSTYKVLQGLGYPVLLNENNFSVTEKANSTSEKNTRIITVRVTNIPSLGRDYLDFYSSTGQMSNISYKSITLKFKINTKNGYIKSIVRDEVLNGTAMGFAVTSTVHSTLTIQSMNKAIVLGDDL